MTTIAPQITSLGVVYSTVYSDANQRKHQSSASLAFVLGIHRDRWIPRTKGQLRGKCFHWMTSSCGLLNNSILHWKSSTRAEAFMQFFLQKIKQINRPTRHILLHSMHALLCCFWGQYPREQKNIIGDQLAHHNQCSNSLTILFPQ